MFGVVRGIYTVELWLSKVLKFADDTKLSHRVSLNGEIGDLQEDLNVLFKWSINWQMPFNTDKCKVMHLGQNNKKIEYEMG